jgi:hypothetical protein
LQLQVVNKARAAVSINSSTPADKYYSFKTTRCSNQTFNECDDGCWCMVLLLVMVVAI